MDGAMRIRFAIVLLALLTGLLAPAQDASAVSVQELTRLRGQGQSILQGFGLVIGLPGTGDSGEDLVVARPLAKMLESQGAAIESFDELANAQSVAVVVVTCTIPESGAKADDRFDVTVSAINNPESLAGGELFLAPLRGPLPGQPVFAVAQGSVTIVGGNPTRGTVRGGARIVRDINMNVVGADGTITLIVRPVFAGWTITQLLADTINQHRVGFEPTAPEIAFALDSRSVRVRIPDEELADPANFISDIISVEFDASLMDLPARVVINERDGVIVATGDARVSPMVVSQGDLVVTTVSEPESAEKEAPTLATGEQDAKVEDLLAAFRELDVAIRDQIRIIMELHRTGRLHAEVVID
jgi:flagellar P-ring protein precursor FlgI